MNLFKWFIPGIRVKRWVLVTFLGASLIILGLSLLIDAFFPRFLVSFFSNTTSILLIIILLISGFIILARGIRNLINEILYAYLDENYETTYGTVVDVMMRQNVVNHAPRVVAIGGGTGLSSLLRGVKHITHKITAVVTVADDGGSSGRLREMSIPAPGDIRNCIVALASASDDMRKLFNYRYSEKDKAMEGLVGHSFGNIFIATLTKITGSFEDAVRLACRVLDVRGEVLPVTTCENIQLKAKLADGSLVFGESNIGLAGSKIEELILTPNCKITTNAEKAINNAEMIIIGPGSLYTSIVATLLPIGVKNAIRKSKAKVVYVANIMTQKNETIDHTIADHIEVVEKYLGKGVINTVLVNSRDLPDDVLKRYRDEGADLAKIDRDRIDKMGYNIVYADLVYEDNMIPVRHDSYKVGLQLQRLILRDK